MTNHPGDWSYPQAPYPAPAPPPVPVRPPVVTYAVWLMCAGAAVSVLNGVVDALMARSLVTKIFTQTLNQLPPGEPRPQVSTDLLTRLFAIAIVAGGIIYAGLWLWMAWKNHRGRSWARVLSTVFLCLYGLSALSAVVRISLVGFGFLIPSLVMFGIGLAAVVMIWRPEANRYYQAVTANDAFGKGKAYPPGGGYGGYGYGGYGYGSPQSVYGYPPPAAPPDQPQPPPPGQPS